MMTLPILCAASTRLPIASIARSGAISVSLNSSECFYIYTHMVSALVS